MVRAGRLAVWAAPGLGGGAGPGANAPAGLHPLGGGARVAAGAVGPGPRRRAGTPPRGATMNRWWVAALCLVPCLAMSHPLDPALLELRESPGAPVEVRWREPMGPPGSAPLVPALPERCRPVSSVREEPSGQA